jgi:hypothetical protein
MKPNHTVEHNTAPALGFGGRRWCHYGLRAHYVVVGAVWLSFSFGVLRFCHIGFGFSGHHIQCPSSGHWHTGHGGLLGSNCVPEVSEPAAGGDGGLSCLSVPSV